MYERILLITQSTRLEGLIRRFNTKRQARFYLERSGGDFDIYEEEHTAYQEARETLHRVLSLGLQIQELRREHLPTYLFRKGDLIVTLGRDGLVANSAKYVGAQPIVAVNPDPARIDGILLPFLPTKVRGAVQGLLEGNAEVKEVTMAEAVLHDGQRLLAFNDLFLGSSNHVSARYRLEYRDHSEHQSSSGVLVSTGAGSTGWLSSVFQMAASVTRLAGGEGVQGFTSEWDDPRLTFVTREPYVSKNSSAQLTAGRIKAGEVLVVESSMPEGGVIFSDGVPEDFLSFCSGATATVRAAEQRAHLVMG